MTKKHSHLRKQQEISAAMFLIHQSLIRLPVEISTFEPLKSLVSMLLNGANIESQDSEESQACLTIAQLILFNMKKTGKSSGKGMRHCQEREPPLPLYLGMNIHTQTKHYLCCVRGTISYCSLVFMLIFYYVNFNHE